MLRKNTKAEPLTLVYHYISDTVSDIANALNNTVIKNKEDGKVYYKDATGTISEIEFLFHSFLDFLFQASSPTSLDAPTLNTPTSFKSNGSEISWNSVSGATSYIIECSLNNLFSSIAFTTTSTLSLYRLIDLNPSTLYYVRVRATNGTIVSNNSNIQSFTTTTAPTTVGTILNRSGFTDADDFEDFGTMTSTYNTGGVIFNGGGGVYDAYSIINPASTPLLNNPVLLEEYTISGSFIVNNSNGATTYGVGIGDRGYMNVVAESCGVVTQLPLFTDPPSFGKVYINIRSQNTYSSNSGTPSTSLSVVNGDTITFSIQYTNDFTGGVDNFVVISSFTKGGTTVTSTYAYPKPYGSLPFLPNVIRPALYAFGATEYKLTNLNITSPIKRNAKVVVLGDSRGKAYNASSLSNIWVHQLDNEYSDIYNWSGGFSTTLDIRNTLPAVLDLTPQRVILCIGLNDIRLGRTLGQIQTDYSYIVSQLKTQGVTVMHLLLPSSTYNQESFGLFPWIRSNFSMDEIIEVPGMSSGDGVHPSALGNTQIFTTVKAVLDNYL